MTRKTEFPWCNWYDVVKHLSNLNNDSRPIVYYIKRFVFRIKRILRYVWVNRILKKSGPLTLLSTCEKDYKKMFLHILHFPRNCECFKRPYYLKISSKIIGHSWDLEIPGSLHNNWILKNKRLNLNFSFTFYNFSYIIFFLDLI